MNESALRQLAAELLHAVPPPLAPSIGERATAWQGPSDFDLNPAMLPESLLAAPPRLAAVLIPVVIAEDERLEVILTQRTDHLPSHAGQIAFPGGKPHPEDRDLADTALREAHEEIGLEPRLVERIGYLDWYRTGTGFAIAPLVGLVRPGFTLAPNPDEVSDVFQVPLGFLLDVANHRRDSRVLRGQERHFHAMPYGDRYIWGATAGIIKNLHARLSRT